MEDSLLAFSWLLHRAWLVHTDRKCAGVAMPPVRPGRPHPPVRNQDAVSQLAGPVTSRRLIHLLRTRPA